MSATATEPQQPTPEAIRTPEQEQAEKGLGVAPASELALEDINPLNAHLFRENRWQDYFRRLRNEDPVHFNELETAGRYWSVTKYEDIKAVSAEPQTFSSAQGITLGFRPDRDAPTLFPPSSPSFIMQDGMGHDDQRKTVQPSVAPRNLAKLEPIIRDRTIRVLDSLPEGETFDWVDTVSIELTTMMLATLFDFPMEDRRKLTRWSDIVFAIPQPGGVVETGEQKREEMLECVEYFAKLWELRRENPGNDLVSMLAHGEATKHLSAANHLGNLLLLIVGGNDTTRNSMSGGVLALNQFPDQFEKLKANPDLIPNMNSEIIRWQTPLAYMRRIAKADTVLNGQFIRKGDKLVMWYASGNRDERVFENPDDFIIDRANARNHIAFGFGVHRCMGNRLAEMQLRILWEELLPRFENIEVVGDPEYVQSNFVRGISKMMVRLTPTSSA